VPAKAHLGGNDASRQVHDAFDQPPFWRCTILLD
jgi:hypothetical protein